MAIFTAQRVAAFGILCTAAIGGYQVWNEHEKAAVQIAQIRQEAHQQLEAAKREHDEKIRTLQLSQDRMIADLKAHFIDRERIIKDYFLDREKTMSVRLVDLEEKSAKSGPPVLQAATFTRTMPPRGRSSSKRENFAVQPGIALTQSAIPIVAVPHPVGGAGVPVAPNSDPPRNAHVVDAQIPFPFALIGYPIVGVLKAFFSVVETVSD